MPLFEENRRPLFEENERSLSRRTDDRQNVTFTAAATRTSDP